MRFLSNAENNLRLEWNMNIQYLFDDISFLFCKNLFCHMTLEKLRRKKYPRTFQMTSTKTFHEYNMNFQYIFVEFC